MASYGELMTALQALSYAKKAYSYGQIGSSLYSAAQGGAIGPATGLGVVAAVPALGMMVANLIRTAQGKNRQATVQGQQKQIQEAATTLQDVSKPTGGLKEWLDGTTWQGMRRGDLLYDIASKNLKGDWVQARAGMAPGAGSEFSWLPNEQFKPVVAMLTALGYRGSGIDPTGLISRSGGWGDTKDRYGLPNTLNTTQAVKNWDNALSWMGGLFSKLPGIKQRAQQVPAMPLDQVLNYAIPDKYMAAQYQEAGIRPDLVAAAQQRGGEEYSQAELDRLRELIRTNQLYTEWVDPGYGMGVDSGAP